MKTAGLMNPTNFDIILLTRFVLKALIITFFFVNLSIYYTWKNIKSAYNNNKFNISALTWNDKFDLPDRSCSVSDIQDYFDDIIKRTRR